MNCLFILLFPLQRARDFIAVPITLNIVLMIANSLLIWAAISGHKILLLPWLVLYGLEWVLFAVGLGYVVIVVWPAYVKVLAFLSVCPVLVVFAFCWIVVKAFYNYLRDLRVKEAVAAVYSSSHKVNMVSFKPLYLHQTPLYFQAPSTTSVPHVISATTTTLLTTTSS